MIRDTGVPLFGDFLELRCPDPQAAIGAPLFHLWTRFA